MYIIELDLCGDNLEQVFFHVGACLLLPDVDLESFQVEGPGGGNPCVVFKVPYLETAECLVTMAYGTELTQEDYQTYIKEV